VFQKLPPLIGQDHMPGLPAFRLPNKDGAAVGIEITNPKARQFAIAATGEKSRFD
jgi:hypothetical protein